MTTAAATIPSAPDGQFLPTQAPDRPPVLLGVLCVVLTTLPTYVVLPGPLKGNGSPARMIQLIMFGLVVLGFLLIRRTTPIRHFNPGSIILVLYLAIWLAPYGAGLLTLEDYVVASSRTRTMVGLLAFVGTGLYVIARVRTARQRHVVLGCLAVGLAYACLLGVLQTVTPIDFRFLIQPPGFTLNVQDMSHLALQERMGVKRVMGTSQHPIEFSVLAGITIPLMIYLARNAETKRVRQLSVVGGVLAMLALPASVSRSGLITMVVALVVYMFVFPVRQIAKVLGAASVAIAAYAGLFPHVANALWSTITGSAEDSSVEARIDDYARVSKSFSEHPVFGVGLGGAVPSEYGYLDNQWLQVIVQGGAVGLLAMVILTVGAIFGIAAANRAAASPREREQAYVMGGMIAGILASSFTFDLFGYQQATVIFFILYGLLWSGYSIPLPDTGDGHRRPTRIKTLMIRKGNAAGPMASTH